MKGQQCTTKKVRKRKIVGIEKKLKGSERDYAQYYKYQKLELNSTRDLIWGLEGPV